jgi:hypothetical protein
MRAGNFATGNTAARHREPPRQKEGLASARTASEAYR